jgi:hypothetical protein
VWYEAYDRIASVIRSSPMGALDTDPRQPAFIAPVPECSLVGIYAEQLREMPVEEPRLAVCDSALRVQR